MLVDGAHCERRSPIAVLNDAFLQAVRAQPHAVRESRYVFGGLPVRLRVVGRELADHLAQPIAHLRADDVDCRPARLTIDLWDERAVGVPRPFESGNGGFAYTWDGGYGVFTASGDDRIVGYQFRQSGAWLDRATAHIIGWSGDAQRLSLYERGKPLQVPLSVWHRDRGVQVVHAGCVARNGRGVLLPGAGGAGKSTSALACLLGGFDYLGDDYIGLAAGEDGAFVGHSLYSSTWLASDHASRFPQLFPHVIRPTDFPEEKFLVLLSRLFPQRLARWAPIHAVALPRVTHRAASQVRRASRAEALLALAPSSLLALIPRPGPGALEKLSRLVQRVPAYWLEIGRDLSDIPPRVEELLAEARAS